MPATCATPSRTESTISTINASTAARATGRLKAPSITIIATGASSDKPDCTVFSGASDSGIHGNGKPSAVNPSTTMRRPGKALHTAGGSGISWTTISAPNSPARMSKWRSPVARGVGLDRAKVAAIAITAAICNTAFDGTPPTLDPPSVTAISKKPATASACHTAVPRKSSEGSIEGA